MSYDTATGAAAAQLALYLPLLHCLNGHFMPLSSCSVDATCLSFTVTIFSHSGALILAVPCSFVFAASRFCGIACSKLQFWHCCNCFLAPLFAVKCTWLVLLLRCLLCFCVVLCLQLFPIGCLLNVCDMFSGVPLLFVPHTLLHAAKLATETAALSAQVLFCWGFMYNLLHSRE